MSKREYRIVDGRRVLVVRHHGFKGFWARWYASCSGCCEAGGEWSTSGYDMHPKHRCWIGGGCHECGYHGIKLMFHFVPFNTAGFERMIERRFLSPGVRRGRAG